MPVFGGLLSSVELHSGLRHGGTLSEESNCSLSVLNLLAHNIFVPGAAA